MILIQKKSAEPTSSVRMKSLIASIESILPSWFQLQKKPPQRILEQNQDQLKLAEL
jgi:hypothetical protein